MCLTEALQMLGLFVAGTLVADALAITGLAYNQYVEEEGKRKERGGSRRPPTSFTACLRKQALEVGSFNAEYVGPLLTAAACTEVIKRGRH